MSANIVTRAIINYLGHGGYKVWRNNNMGVYDRKTAKYRKNPSQLHGVPDIIGFHRKTGIFIAVEVKIGKDKLSYAQEMFLKEVVDSRGIAIVAHSFDDFFDKFKNIRL